MINPLPTVLLTGFTPFDGDALNPSWQAVRALDGKRIARHRVVAVELPTEFGAALPALRRALRTVQPRLAIAFGLAGGRTGISLERVAINVIDARIPDNAGAQPIDVPVLRSGPAAYFSTLPIKAMLAALQQSDISADISQTAGTYVCNQVFYALMHAARRQRFRAGFVHVPWLSGQATRHAAPAMPLAQMQQAAAIIVRVALTTAGDARRSGGAEA
jgi:pyroglutamyl-peptidase